MSDIEREEAIEVMCELIVNAGDGTRMVTIDTNHLRTLHNAGYCLPVEQGEEVSGDSVEWVWGVTDNFTLGVFLDENYIITRKVK